MDLPLHIAHVIASATYSDSREGNLCDRLGRVLQGGHYLFLLPLVPGVQGEVGGQAEGPANHDEPEQPLQSPKLLVKDVAYAVD